MDIYQIIFTRAQSIWGCALKHTIEIDGIAVGVLENGGTLAAYTSPGSHVISFVMHGKIKKSISVLVEPEQHVLRFFVELTGNQSVKVTGENRAIQAEGGSGSTRGPWKRQGIQTLIVAIVVLAISFGVCYILFGGSSPTKPSHTASSLPSDAVTPPPPTPTPVVSVSAKDLWKAYTENKVSADDMYKGKPVAVSGTITDIGQDLVTKAPCISLDAGDSIGIYAIQCFFPKNGDQHDLIAALSDGDSITIYGTCEGTPIMQVQLSDCYLDE